MLIIGLTFCCLGWKVSRAEQKRMYSTSPNTTMSNLESQLMPTISNALLRDPSFPLIVPMAEWITPQVTKNFNYISSNGQDQVQKKPNSRPRAVSLQIPFMGGTIVPSNHVSLTKKFRIRRNSVPPQSSVNDRKSIAFAINDKNETIASRVKRHFSRSKSAEILLTEEHNYNQAPLHLNDIAPVVHPYWWTVSYPPVTRDIACFPISTFNFSPDVKSAVTEVVDVLDRKASLVST